MLDDSLPLEPCSQTTIATAAAAATTAAAAAAAAAVRFGPVSDVVLLNLPRHVSCTGPPSGQQLAPPHRSPDPLRPAPVSGLWRPPVRESCCRRRQAAGAELRRAELLGGGPPSNSEPVHYWVSGDDTAIFLQLSFGIQMRLMSDK